MMSSARGDMDRPKGLLLDYGGTLVEEVSVDMRAGNEWLLAHASYRPPHVTLEHVLDRASRVSRDVASRRDQFHLEAPWSLLTRLIHDFLGVQFDDPMPQLELDFWKASVQTRPMPGARAALEWFHREHVPTAVVSNTAFGEPVIRYELDKHGLAEHLEFIVVSAEYAVRKPNVLLFDTAAARLGREPKDIWFVGDRLDTDIAGAKAAGMTAVWLRPPRADASLSGGADLIAANWDEIVHHCETS